MASGTVDDSLFIGLQTCGVTQFKCVIGYRAYVYIVIVSVLYYFNNFVLIIIIPVHYLSHHLPSLLPNFLDMVYK